MKNNPRCEHLPRFHVASTKSTPFRIEEALNRALASYFPCAASRTVAARVGFCGKCKREVDGCDKDFIEKYDEDVNTALIFVSERFVSHVERI